MPRSAIGTEQTKLTALLQGSSRDEAAATGLPVEAVQDEAYLVEAGDHRTCVAVIERTPPSLAVPLTGWTFQLNGAPIAPDEREATLEAYPFIGNGQPTGADGGPGPRVVINRALICGAQLVGASEVTLSASFRAEGGMEWSERFVWDLH